MTLTNEPNRVVIKWLPASAPANCLHLQGGPLQTGLFGWGGGRGKLSFARLLNLARSYAAGTDLEPLDTAVNDGSNVLQVRVETPVCHVMRVANVVAELRFLSANIAHHRHLTVLLVKRGILHAQCLIVKRLISPRLQLAPPAAGGALLAQAQTATMSLHDKHFNALCVYYQPTEWVGAGNMLAQ